MAARNLYVLPAHAGMIPQFSRPRRSRMCAPRTCGDDPGYLDLRLRLLWCSPHMRG